MNRLGSKQRPAIADSEVGRAYDSYSDPCWQIGYATHMRQQPITVAEEQAMFYREHSLAIIGFAQVEEWLTILLGMCQGTAPTTALQTAFVGIDSFRAKLEFADRFVRIRKADNENHLAAWTRIHGYCEDANRGRNKLAHWRHRIYAPGGRPGMRAVLAPPTLNPKDAKVADSETSREGHAPKIALGVRQVAEIHGAISRASHSLTAFVFVAAGTTPLELPSYVVRVPTLAKMTERYRAEVDAPDDGALRLLPTYLASE